MNRIITAKDYGGSAKQYILKQRDQIKKSRGITIVVRDLDNPSGSPVYAEIWQGQWIARCDHCQTAMFVDADEPVFFCLGCANKKNSNKARPCIFPEQRGEIERLILERPVEENAGLTELESAGMARALIMVDDKPLARSWKPGETVDDIRQQQDAVISSWKREAKKRGIR